VDAFCIIQDDPEEWRVAVREMESVFSSAYFRLAAASSRSLGEGMILPRVPPTCLKLPAPKGASIYISKFIDHFHPDVDGSPLNDRAWVLQERALCCRTIYFTTTQVYMECGEGVRCETLGRIPWDKASFLGDSHFPTKALRYFGGNGILLYQHLYSHYTTLALTKLTDRPLAIAPLERRVAQELRSDSAYGILEGYLSSSLMWTRKNTTGFATSPIKYPSGQKIPSWSWMVYVGPIEYLSTASDMKVTTDITIAFRSFFDLVFADQYMAHDRIEITVPARRLARADTALVQSKGVVFDVPLDGRFEMLADQLLCIPVATEKEKPGDEFSELENWVILVAPALETGTSGYKRIGAGIVREGDMVADTVFVKLW